jgi:hypothetical protein
MADVESQGSAGRLNAEICDRARLARNPRFDGQFVTGVLTTRIYCRPICPVRPARSAHVRFFPSAAAGEPLVASDDSSLTTLFPLAAVLMQASLAHLGLSRRAADGIRRLARAVVSSDLRFDPRVAFDELVNALTRETDLDLPSAHWVAIRTLGEPDANPFGAASVSTPAVPPWLDPTAQEALRP